MQKRGRGAQAGGGGMKVKFSSGPVKTKIIIETKFQNNSILPNIISKAV